MVFLRNHRLGVLGIIGLVGVGLLALFLIGPILGFVFGAFFDVFRGLGTIIGGLIKLAFFGVIAYLLYSWSKGSRK